MSKISNEDLRAAYLAHRREHGQQSAVTVLDRFGVKGIDEVPDDQRDEVLEALNAAPATRRGAERRAERFNAGGTLDPVAIFAKFNSAAPGRRGGDR